MDAGDDRQLNAPGQTPPELLRETMLGNRGYVGLLLAIFCFVRAFWSVASRFILYFLSLQGDALAISRFSNLNAVAATAFFTLVFAVLYVLAARAAQFRLHGALFIVCAAGELLRVAPVVLAPLFSGMENSGLMFSSVFSSAATLCTTAAFLIFAVSRDTPKDVRVLSWIIAPFLILSMLASLGVYFAAWMLLSGSFEPWQRVLAYGNIAVFFVGLITAGLMGFCFLMMRIPVIRSEYPPKRMTP